MRLFAAAGARHGVKITKVMYLFRPLMKEYKYSIHAVWDRDFWRHAVHQGEVALAYQDYIHALHPAADPEQCRQPQRIKRSSSSLLYVEQLQEQDVSQFDLAALHAATLSGDTWSTWSSR